MVVSFFVFRFAPGQSLQAEQGEVSVILGHYRFAQLPGVFLQEDRRGVLSEDLGQPEMIPQPLHRLHHKAGVCLQAIQDDLNKIVISFPVHKNFLHSKIDFISE